MALSLLVVPSPLVHLRCLYKDTRTWTGYGHRIPLPLGVFGRVSEPGKIRGHIHREVTSEALTSGRSDWGKSP